jgi:hypothetical protein
MGNIAVEGLMFFLTMAFLILLIPIFDCITIFMRMEFKRMNEGK